MRRLFILWVVVPCLSIVGFAPGASPEAVASAAGANAGPGKPSQTPAPTPDGPPKLDKTHAAVLTQWLRQHQGLRLLSTRDAPMDPKDIDYFRKQGGGPAYHPCYVVGDANGDGQVDFAVLLFDATAKKNPGAIAIFNGPFRPGLAKSPALFEHGYQIENWYLWCERKPKFTLYEGLAESGTFGWFTWKNGKYEHVWAEQPDEG